MHTRGMTDTYKMTMRMESCLRHSPLAHAGKRLNRPLGRSLILTNRPTGEPT